MCSSRKELIMVKKNNSNKPLMIYTSLIFIVAIVMVVIAYFGQKHLENVQIQQNITTTGIQERASQISDENRMLMEINSNLSSENEDLTSENARLSEENQIMASQKEISIKLHNAYMLINKNNYKQARAMLEEIYTEGMTPEQKEFYDTLVKKVTK